jgi:hypothetical protein
MSNRSRRRARSQPPHQPSQPQAAATAPAGPPDERLLLDQIAQGELDPHLTAIADAIHARLDLLETVNSA